MTGERHHAEPKQEGGKREEEGSAENRLSGSVFRNAVGLLGVIVSDHLPSQFPLAGKGLTACVPIGPAIHCVLIGWKINRLQIGRAHV